MIIYTYTLTYFMYPILSQVKKHRFVHHSLCLYGFQATFQSLEPGPEIYAVKQVRFAADRSTVFDGEVGEDLPC